MASIPGIMSADSYGGGADWRADSDGDWRKQADRGAVETAERPDRIGGRGHGRGCFVQADRGADRRRRARGKPRSGNDRLTMCGFADERIFDVGDFHSTAWRVGANAVSGFAAAKNSTGP